MVRFPDLRNRAFRVFPDAEASSDIVRNANRLQWRDRVGVSPTSRNRRGQRQIVPTAGARRAQKSGIGMGEYSGNAAPPSAVASAAGFS